MAGSIIFSNPRSSGLLVDTLDDQEIHGVKTFMNNAEFEQDLHIQGNLIVDGVGYESKLQVLKSQSDLIVMREGSAAGLGANYAGMLIKNYTANNTSLGVVCNSTGELRIGDLVYSQTYIYKNNPDDTNYYYDRNGTNVVNFSTITNAYFVNFIEELDDGKAYAFEYLLYKKTTDDTEPVLTRDESTNMSGNYITMWNATDNKAVTVNGNKTGSASNLNIKTALDVNQGATFKITSSNAAGKAQVKYTNGSTANTTHTLPAKDGTILNSGTSNLVLGGTANSNVTITGRSNVILGSGESDPVITITSSYPTTGSNYVKVAELKYKPKSGSAVTTDIRVPQATGAASGFQNGVVHSDRDLTGLSGFSTCPISDGIVYYKDTNTWTANAVNTAGYVAGPTKASNANQCWMTDGDGKPAWRNVTASTVTTTSDSTNATRYILGRSSSDSKLYYYTNVYMNNSTGALTATSVTASSQRCKKKNIKKYKESGIEVLNKVDIVQYNYKKKYGDDKMLHVGFIADDTDELLAPQHEVMDYTNCIGVLIKAVQELSEKVARIEEQLNGK